LKGETLQGCASSMRSLAAHRIIALLVFHHTLGIESLILFSFPKLRIHNNSNHKIIKRGFLVFVLRRLDNKLWRLPIIPCFALSLPLWKKNPELSYVPKGVKAAHTAFEGINPSRLPREKSSKGLFYPFRRPRIIALLVFHHTSKAAQAVCAFFIPLGA